MAEAIRDDLPALREVSASKAAQEIVVFGLLWGGGALVAAVAWAGESGWACWPAIGAGVACAALGLNAFVLLMHEGMHHTLFPSRSWNRWVAVALGATFFTSFSAWRVLHLRHHAYLGDPRDPDDYRRYTRHRHLLWLLHVLRLLVASFVYVLAIPTLAWRDGSPGTRRRLVVEYLALAAIYALVAATVPWTALLYGWLMPLVLVAYLTNLRGLSQHSITDASDPYLATRTMHVPRIISFCLLDENYHLEHHFFPEVPGYNLHKVHALIWHRLPRAVTGTSYVAFLVRFLRATLSLDETPIGLVYPAGEASQVAQPAPVDAPATVPA
jgi:fatty acid desaturase